MLDASASWKAHSCYIEGSSWLTLELLEAVYPGGSRGLGAFRLRFGGLSSWMAQ